MVTAILGISAFYHDSAAALMVDGTLVAAAQEERFSRQKHDPRFPQEAIAYCLREARLGRENLDYVAFYDKPLAKFDRLLETYLAYAPRGFASFRLAIPVWLKEKLFLRRILREHFPESRTRIVYLEHHESHAASAFFPSPFAEAAILTLDGVGEWSTTTLGHGSGRKIELLQHLQFPHSLGLCYSAFTYHCGFKVNSGEYKLMGLAPYGRPIYRDRILENLIDLKDDGSFRLDMSYFDYCQGLTMTNGQFDRLVGGPPRRPESTLEQRHMDLAASIQAVTEEVVLRLGRTVHRLTGDRKLVLAGGVALNCVANGRLQREGPFERLWIQPAAGDAGGALGAAWFVWHQLLEHPREAKATDRQQGSFLGPRYSSAEVDAFLDRLGVHFERFNEEVRLLEGVATLLAQEKVVGWFQGRMEFGPRALGGRSILGDPRSARMQATMNLKIKFRESFRPFAPAVLQERAADWFEIDPEVESPYMLLVAQIRREHRREMSSDEERTMHTDADLRRRVNIPRSVIPAVTHVDFSARLQTVDAERNARFHGLLQAFERQTGCPILVNTSFNIRGEPIVCTLAEAYACFCTTDMDVLVLEDRVIRKDANPDLAATMTREEYMARFALD